MSISPFLRCSDITNSLAFYTSTLDFKVVQAPDPEAFMSMHTYLKREDSFAHLSQHSGDGVLAM